MALLVVLLLFMVVMHFDIIDACTVQTTVPCTTIDSTTRVMNIYGNYPIGTCTLVTYGTNKLLFDPILINEVWITVNNTDAACIANVPGRAQNITNFFSTNSSYEFLLLNVTAQYFRLVVVPRGCLLNCTIVPFSSNWETGLAAANMTIYPIFNNLNLLGPYCLYNGTLDPTYVGAGYRCICNPITTFMGPSCELLDVTINTYIPLFNVFRSATNINLRFSFFSIGITGTRSILTLKSSNYQKMVEVIVVESSVVLKLNNSATFNSTIKIDTQNWFDFNLVVNANNATLRINTNTMFLSFNPTLTVDFRSFYLVFNEAYISTSDICIKNLIINAKVIDFNNPSFVSCCQTRCSCTPTQDCDCKPLISSGNSVCYCKAGYIASNSNSNCVPGNMSLAQMTSSVTSLFPLNNIALAKIDFSFQTLSILGSLLSVILSNPPINISIQIVANNLTLNVPNQPVRTIRYNVSDGQIHNATLTFKPNALDMFLDNSLNYTTDLPSWFISATFPLVSSTISILNFSLGPMQLPFNSTVNNLTTCFSPIRFNSMTAPFEVSPSLNANFSSQCLTGPKCSTGLIFCTLNQVCKDNEWQNTKCICITNFTSINSTCTYNLCITNPCLNGGTCAYGGVFNNYTCVCPPAFNGINCQNAVSAVSLWWIAVLVVLILLLILIIFLLVYCCCFRHANASNVPFISKINENIVTYNEQAGECDYSGPPIDFALMKLALKNGHVMPNGSNKQIPDLMNKKDEFDKNNKDLILDHPLEYGYEGYDSDHGSVSSIGSKSATSEMEMPPLENLYDT